MCDVCGCGDPAIVSLEVHERILAGNDRGAAHNRAHLRERGIAAINLMGAPGAGKTALLEATRRAAPGMRLAAVSGDLATEHDALRLQAAGIPAISITTGTACHLDAAMVHRALHHLPEGPLDGLVIENVGNLVCPAIYDLGQVANVVALSVTEGVDKPEKYPVMFRAADLVVVTKADLLPHLPEVDVEAIRAGLGRVMPEPRMLLVSARTGLGIGDFVAWMLERCRIGLEEHHGPSLLDPARTGRRGARQVDHAG
jgi:hydrogenase nickel incorporation protein HypB